MTETGRRLNAAFDMLWTAYQTGSYISVHKLGLDETLLARLILETKIKTNGDLTVRTSPCRQNNMFPDLGYGPRAVGLVRLSKV